MGVMPDALLEMRRLTRVRGAFAEDDKTRTKQSAQARAAENEVPNNCSRGRSFGRSNTLRLVRAAEFRHSRDACSSWERRFPERAWAELRVSPWRRADEFNNFPGHKLAREEQAPCVETNGALVDKSDHQPPGTQDAAVVISGIESRGLMERTVQEQIVTCLGSEGLMRPQSCKWWDAVHIQHDVRHCN